MTAGPVIVALSGGVDSAVAAWLLREAGHDVECLHMTNWEDDDGYCDAARDFHDARRVCRLLGVPLHRVNFAREYRERVFARFLEESRRGRTPNPDVLCNREIKFGVLRRYARRLGARALATGHYARLDTAGGRPLLLKGRDRGKDQSYFLHAVHEEDLEDVLFPLGDLTKDEVRGIARRARLPVAEKKDSTGICFIGERPFAEFLARFVAAQPGPIRAIDGTMLGTHRGLAFYTLGQRRGLGIGGVAARANAPWYVVEKNLERNELLVAQGHDHPALLCQRLRATGLHWINGPPRGWDDGAPLVCSAKTRYRQRDQRCATVRTGSDAIEVTFEQPQRAVTPGQYVVLYDGERCLGGAVIDVAERVDAGIASTGEPPAFTAIEDGCVALGVDAAG
ncbi:MAG TPA: tRNA 2-thiouridine(34) synthase MnmA [Gammaproteobacteria bacterium]